MKSLFRILLSTAICTLTYMSGTFFIISGNTDQMIVGSILLAASVFRVLMLSVSLRVSAKIYTQWINVSTPPSAKATVLIQDARGTVELAEYDPSSRKWNSTVVPVKWKPLFLPKR